MLTGSSKASEVAKEKGSMVDIHLPQIVGRFREALSELWMKRIISSGLCAVIIRLTRNYQENYC
jgi:hypothetical protein